jgi:hypothetical protein
MPFDEISQAYKKVKVGKQIWVELHGGPFLFLPHQAVSRKGAKYAKKSVLHL